VAWKAEALPEKKQNGTSVGESFEHSTPAREKNHPRGDGKRRMMRKERAARHHFCQISPDERECSGQKTPVLPRKKQCFSKTEPDDQENEPRTRQERG